MATITERAGTAADAAPAEPDPRRWMALAVLAIAQLMIVLDATIVNIALPSAQKALHISDANRQWVMTAYTLAFGGLLLLGGRIADYIGRKRMFIIGLFGFAAASALGGIAPRRGHALRRPRRPGRVRRAAWPPPPCRCSPSPSPRPRSAPGRSASTARSPAAAAAIGLILGGVLTEYASWRWTLLVNVPIAIVAAVGATRSSARAGRSRQHPLRHPRRGHRRPLGLVALVYGFTKASTDGWTLGDHAGLLGVGVVLLAAFVAHRAARRAPAAADARRPRPQPRRLVPRPRC